MGNKKDEEQKSPEEDMTKNVQTGHDISCDCSSCVDSRTGNHNVPWDNATMGHFPGCQCKECQ